MPNLKIAIRALIRKFGWDVHRFVPATSHTAQLCAILDQLGADAVFDVGANQGQYASELRAGGYNGEIISFEPLSSAYGLLQENASRDGKWKVHPQCALGDHTGTIAINIAANSASSSVLPMLDTHLAAAPNTAYTGQEQVPIFKLDDVAPGYLAKFSRPFLKIDTQGFEWEVLDGASAILPHICGIQLELTLVPLYEGQHLWEQLIARLKDAGFDLWAIQTGFTEPHTGRTLQIDGIFIRNAA